MSADEWEEIDTGDDSDWEEVDHSDILGSQEPKHSQIQTAVEHFGKGASLGYIPQLQAATESGIEKLTGALGIGPAGLDEELREQGFEVPEETYLQKRDANIKRQNEQSNEHGITAGLANVLGGVTTGIASAPLLGTTNAATAPGRMWQAAKIGAGVGTVSNPGDIEGELSPIQLKERAINGTIGAGLGAVTQGGIEGVGALAKPLKSNSEKAAQWLKDKAAKVAARALGAERGSIKTLGMDKVTSAGRQALDEGLLSPLASTDDLIARNKAVQTKGGEMMGEAYSAIDDAGASTFNPLEVASKVDEKLGGFYRSPINKGETNQLENTLESILMRGDKNIPLREAQSLKQELKKVANWKNNHNPTDKEKMAREAYGIVSAQIDDALEKGASIVDNAGLTETLKQGKSLFSNSKSAETLLNNKQAREQGNSFMGLTDVITGAGALGYGGVTNDWQTAGGIVLAKKGLQKYGAQNAALGLDKVAKFLLKTPKFQDLARNNPNAFHSMVVDFASKARKSGAELMRSAESDQETPSFVSNQMSEEQKKQSFIEGN